jgi:hypothetical protein
MKMKPILYASIVFILALGLLIYFQLGSAQKTVPKIKLSYFADTDQFAEAITGRLRQEITGQQSFWFGVEPEKPQHLKLALSLKNKIEVLNGKFDSVFVDKELGLSTEQLSEISNVTEVLVRDEWPAVADQLMSFKDKKYFLITAAIYSTSLIADNPVHKIKNKNQSNMMTFSSGYFSSDVNDEKNGLFRCSTEDKEGISAWACALVNKSRTQRKKLNLEKSSFAGLMDLTGQNDYMILMR